MKNTLLKILRWKNKTEIIMHQINIFSFGFFFYTQTFSRFRCMFVPNWSCYKTSLSQLLLIRYLRANKISVEKKRRFSKYIKHFLFRIHCRLFWRRITQIDSRFEGIFKVVLAKTMVVSGGFVFTSHLEKLDTCDALPAKVGLATVGHHVWWKRPDFLK